MASDLEQIKKDHHLFDLVRPIGYDFDQVEKAINDYKTTISNTYELIADKDQCIHELQARCDSLEKEVTDARLQMEAITIPEYSPQQSLNIIENFGEGESLPNVQQGMQQNPQPSPQSGQTPPLPEEIQQGNGSSSPEVPIQEMGSSKLKRKIPKIIQ